MTGSRLTVALFGAALAFAAVAAAQRPEPTGAPELPGPPRFSLGDISGLGPESFLLFKDAWLPDPDAALFGPPSLWRGAASPAPPRLVGLPTFGVSVRLGEETTPEGRRKIVLAPLYRSWDDLTGWEKFSVTLQYAGAAAAAATFAGKLIH